MSRVLSIVREGDGESGAETERNATESRVRIAVEFVTDAALSALCLYRELALSAATLVPDLASFSRASGVPEGERGAH